MHTLCFMCTLSLLESGWLQPLPLLLSCSLLQSTRCHARMHARARAHTHTHTHTHTPSNRTSLQGAAEEGGGSSLASDEAGGHAEDPPRDRRTGPGTAAASGGRDAAGTAGCGQGECGVSVRGGSERMSISLLRSRYLFLSLMRAALSPPPLPLFPSLWPYMPGMCAQRDG